jgi:glycosyltransferase involved in cell wall biosynthesis
MLTDYFPPHVGGGVEKAVYEVSKRLVKGGVDVVILTLNTDRARDFEVLDGIRIHRCAMVSLTGVIGAQLSFSPSTPFKMLELCQKENPDIVHANNRFFFTTVCAAALKKLMRKPLIVTLHLGPMNFKGRGVLGLAIRIYEGVISRSIVRLADEVMAVSGAVRDHALKLGARPDDVVEVPNGVDAQEFKPGVVSGSNGAKKVICVGRLIQNKGVQFLVGAAPLVLSRHPNTKFIVVGDGPMKEDLIQLAGRLGVGSAFNFLGTVPSVADLLRSCDLLVRPSLTEGMPLTVLEAMASGLPVVASNVAGTPEIVHDDETGILVKPGDVDQLAAAVNRILSDEHYARGMGHTARCLINDHYSWDRTVEGTLRAYEAVLNATS